MSFKLFFIYLILKSTITYDIDFNAKVYLKNQDCIELAKHIIMVDVELDMGSDKYIYYIDKYLAMNGSTEIECSKINCHSYSDVGLDKYLVINTDSGESLTTTRYLFSTNLDDLRHVLSTIDDSTLDIILDFTKGYYIFITDDKK